MSLTRIGSIGINTGIAFAGVTTIVTLNTANDALSIGATVNVGSGITLGASGDIFATGVSTVTTLKVGSGVTVSSDGDVFFTGIATGNGSGLTNISAANLTLTNQASDTECFPVFAQAATSNQLPHTNTSLKFNASTGALTATSFVGSGANLTGIDTDLVSDTSPQLGGNLDVNTKNIVFGDSSGASDDRLTFGAGTDLSIYHDGTYNRLESGATTLFVRSNLIEIADNSGNKYIKCIDGGAVELYHNASNKLQTTTSGINVTGNVAPTGNLTLADSGELYLGSGGDLRIFHASGNANFIQSYNDNNLRIHTFGTSAQIQIQLNESENAVVCVPNGAVNLYHDNGLRLSTASNGVSISGRHQVQCGTDAVNTLLQTTNTGGAYIQHATGASGATIAYTGHSSQLCLSPTVGNFAIRFEGDALEFSKSNSIQARITSHGGIAFGSDTAAVNTLDDYEEGTHTVTDQSGAGLSISGSMTYTKIGRFVHVQFDITYPSTSNTANALMSLPFTYTAGYGSGVVGWANKAVPTQCHVANATVALMDNSGSNIHMQNNEASTFRFIGACSYFAA